ncbi:MAG: aminotransferase class IV [Cyanobacteria bacterium P01_G01_bin.19]
MYWYDGKQIDSGTIELSVNAPGLCYGATIFTTMRVHNRSLNDSLTYWQAHCDRLKLSIQAFDWQQPDWNRLKKGASVLSARFPVLRMTIFPDGKEWITGRNLPSDLTSRQSAGIVAWVAAADLFQRKLASHKTGNYLSAYLARNQAISHQAQEAILTDPQGNWLETSTGNLWGWQKDCWYTPLLDGNALPGIQRSHLLGYLQKNNIPVQENVWTPEFVAQLEAISYSNCVVELVPIRQVIYQNKLSNYSLRSMSINN